MDALDIPYRWKLSMKDGSTPILAGHQHQKDNRRLVAYLQDRDRHRHREALTIPRPPRWTDTTLALASQIYNVQNQLIWDKS